MTWKQVGGELGKIIWSLLRLIILLGLSFVILYPVLFMLSTAFKPLDQVTDPSVIWIPKSLTLGNFRLAIGAMHYLQSLGNTVRICVVSSIVQVVSCSLVGYGFARFKFKGRSIVFAMVLFTIVVPPQTIAVPLYMLYAKFSVPFIATYLEQLTGYRMTVNLLNNPLSFYIPAIFGVGIRSGLYIFIFRQFFRGLPKELEEAAIIDGCGVFRTFLRIMAPNAGSAYLTVFLFSMVWYWNDFFTSSMLMPGKTTLAVALASLRVSLSTQGVDIMDPFMVTTRLQAGALLVVGPLLIMYIFLQRYYIQSVERTGIIG